MSEIDGLTTQKKSVMLATAAGWKIINKELNPGAWLRVIADTNGNDLGIRSVGGGVRPVEMELRPGWIPDLYQQENMAGAWRVLNWAMGKDSPLHGKDGSKAIEVLSRLHYWIRQSTDKPPAEAQCRWLDEILSLAIEAGLVERPE